MPATFADQLAALTSEMPQERVPLHFRRPSPTEKRARRRGSELSSVSSRALPSQDGTTACWLNDEQTTVQPDLSLSESIDERSAVLSAAIRNR